MNIWEPQPLSGVFLAAQDAELQAQLADKGIVEPEGALWQGDITQLKVDAIVNAANSRGLGCWHPLHGCIDNAIHSAAGLQLRQECNDILRGDEIATGDAIITKGYNLPAKYVIHTVGPIIATGIPTKEQERQLLVHPSGARERLPQHLLLLYLHGRVPFPKPPSCRDCSRDMQRCTNTGFV